MMRVIQIVLRRVEFCITAYICHLLTLSSTSGKRFHGDVFTLTVIVVGGVGDYYPNHQTTINISLIADPPVWQILLTVKSPASGGLTDTINQGCPFKTPPE